MEFIKRNEIIEKFDENWSYFSITVLIIESELDKTKFADKEIIESLIKSKYHFWNGENNPNGLSFTNIQKSENQNSENKINGIKFCGQFNNNRIDEGDYKRVNFDEIEKNILIQVEKNYSSKFLPEIELKLKNVINEHFRLNTKNYLLNLNTESDVEKISEYHIFSFFIRFIVITENNEFVKIIEFGAD